MTDRYLVVGNPISHSLSPVIQQAALIELSVDAVYLARQVDAGGMTEIVDDVRTGRLAGANVTMPHKGLACELVDRVDGDAAIAQSVNTLLRAGEEVVGLSTDIPAIRAEWQRRALPDSSVLILGSGGAAAAALVALDGLELYVSARHVSNLESLRRRLEIAFETVPWATPVPGVALVNATPLGMNGESLPPGLLAAAEGLFDMAYGSLPTPAVVGAKTLGHPVVDGLDMLVAQAALSFEAWTGFPAPLEVMRKAAQIAQGW
jgi:shikimate dehydrogenase